MKNLQEQISKIKGLMKIINEEDYGIPYDKHNDDDTSSDGARDEDAEKIFMDCMDEIKNIYGGNMDRSAYIEMIDKYLGTDNEEDMGDDEDMDDNEELPFK